MSELKPEDLQISAWPAPTDGGMQTGSIPHGVKVTHIPSGLSVEYDRSRKQHVNKAEAIKRIKAMIADAQFPKGSVVDEEV